MFSLSAAHGSGSDVQLYGGPWFTAASALPLRAGLGRPGRLIRLLVAAAAHPWRAIALLVLVARSPTVDLAITDSAAGRLLRDYFGARAHGLVPHNRLCRGVLLLPRAHGEYLRGRRRQAVRTNLRRAKAAGIRCEQVCSPSCALTAVHQVMDGRHSSPTEQELACLTTRWSKLLEEPALTLLVARGASGRALAVSAVLIDDDVALIRLAVASNHEARWCLHGYLVEILISRGVRCLLSEGDGPFGALGYSPAIQYYQRLLGYELRHITTRRTPRLAFSAGPRRAA